MTTEVDANGKIALVTGGARRIGRAIAVHLHSLGYDLAIAYQHSAKEAATLQVELNKSRQNSCKIFCADISRFDGCSANEAAASTNGIESLIEQLTATYNRLDVLVNNASGFEPTPIESCTPEEFEAMMGSNLRGPYFLIQGLLPLLRVRGASIVNIVDTHVERPLRDFNVYGAAKAGLASLTRSLAVELAPDIRVNAVAPGAILWPESDVAYSPEERESTVCNTPLQRMGAAEDIAEAVAFLAGSAAFVTGQILAVDGGRGLVT